MQDEIKQYKEEMKKQQLAELQKQEKMKMMQDLEREKKAMEREVEQSKLQMKNFKLSKFVVLLNSLMMR
jgi:hypothetical protein